MQSLCWLLNAKISSSPTYTETLFENELLVIDSDCHHYCYLQKDYLYHIESYIDQFEPRVRRANREESIIPKEYTSITLYEIPPIYREDIWKRVSDLINSFERRANSCIDISNYIGSISLSSFISSVRYQLNLLQ